MLSLALLSFWVWDTHVMPPGFRRPEFELKQTHVLSDGKTQVNLWSERNPAHPATDEALTTLFSTLVKKSPKGSLDPNSGVLEIERKYLGGPPTPSSGSTDLNIVVANLPPFKRGDGRLATFDGFFNAFDQISESEAAKYEQHSNERNIIYVNSEQDLTTPYMAGVVVHEFAHLMAYGHDSQDEHDAWFNEFIGEAAMQMAGFFTDAPAVEKYRANPAEIPIAGSGYSAHYGALSIFAEYLLTHFPPERFTQLLKHKGTGLERIQEVYGQSWNELFAGYAHWLLEQNPPTRFVVPNWKHFVAEHAPAKEFEIAPTGIAYFKDPSSVEQLKITRIPASCTLSTNVLRSEKVVSKEHQLYALWIESTPPCPAVWDKKKHKVEMFTVETK